MQKRPAVAFAAGLAVSGLIGAACSGLTEGSGSNETLSPLVPDRPGPPVTQVAAVGADGNPVMNTQGSTTTVVIEAADPATLESDDANPLSVAARFLAAAASGDQATAAALEAPERDPTAASWAQAAFAQYTQIAGAQAWGEPTCAEPTGTNVVCSWLQTDAPPTLVLVQQDGVWRVSHPLFNVAGEPQVVGSGCIAGSSSVNFRGGPGTNWPRFTQLAPGTCELTVFDAVQTDAGNGDRWRMVEAAGQRGWIIERVLNIG